MHTTLRQSRPPHLVRAFNRAGVWLSRAGLGPAVPSARSLIAEAQRQAGSQDFGEGDFFEGLSRLLESCEKDAQLNYIGRLALRSDLLHCLRNRLGLQRDRTLHPEIAQQQIGSPVFIVGLPRTGTTILHTLVMQDPQHRGPLTWEVMKPSPPGLENRRARIRSAARNLMALRWLAPDFLRLHAVGPELPQECVSLMSLSFMSDQFDTMYNIPSYRRWFLEQDLAPAYQWHRRFLQHLQFTREPRQWILKAPAHMFALPALLSVYPDARFVQTHRAPLDSITSVASLITILRRIFSDHVDPIEVGREAMRYWAETLERFLAQRDQLPAARVLDLPYADIQRDPISAVQRLYEHFGWDLSDESEQRMRHLLATQPHHQNGFHRYSPSECGLEEREMGEFFAGYCRRFDLPVREGGHTPRADQAEPQRLVPPSDFSLTPASGCE